MKATYDNHSPLIILAGGLGTRLRSVTGELPKALVPIGDKPFLKILIDDLTAQGFHRFIVSCGYQAELIRSFVAKEYGSDRRIKVECVTEPTPLGTGGAISYVLRTQAIDEPFFVVNGDTFIPNGLLQLAEHRADYPCKIGLIKVQDSGRYGTPILNEKKEIIEFREKTPDSGPGFINTGLYELRPSLFQKSGEYSLERDLFPELCAKNLVCGVHLESSFVDIGIPEDYRLFVKQRSKLSAGTSQ